MTFPAVSLAQTPKMGGGYKDVIGIPVEDPATKAIAGALFKPTGTGPFPAVIYMAACKGVNLETYLQGVLRDRLLAKGVALLIVDSFWPRQEWLGVCEKSQADRSYSAREARDIYAALDVLKAMPEIDAKRIFVQGYSLGASGALAAINSETAAVHAAKLAGVIAFYPDCRASVKPSAPALILIGEKDDWTPAAPCQALSGEPNVDVVVYPGAVHAFAAAGVDTEMFGHRVLYDHHAAEDAQARAEAFIAAHVPDAKTQ
jgi:dienelactone hydrolase